MNRCKLYISTYKTGVTVNNLVLPKIQDSGVIILYRIVTPWSPFHRVNIQYDTGARMKPQQTKPKPLILDVGVPSFSMFTWMHGGMHARIQTYNNFTLNLLQTCCYAIKNMLLSHTFLCIIINITSMTYIVNLWNKAAGKTYPNLLNTFALLLNLFDLFCFSQKH